MNEQDKQELAKAVLELIRTDRKIRSAIIDLVCSCPNIMVEY